MMQPKTLRELIASLIELSEENPRSLDYRVVTSRDDEGNGFNVVFYSPQFAESDGLEMDNYTFSENESVVILN